MTVRELIDELQNWERDGYGDAEIVTQDGERFTDTIRREGYRVAGSFVFSSEQCIKKPLIVLRTK